MIGPGHFLLFFAGAPSSASGSTPDVVPAAPSAVELLDDDDSGASDTDNFTNVNTNVRFTISGLLAVAEDGDTLRLIVGGILDEVLDAGVISGDVATITVPGPLADDVYPPSARLIRDGHVGASVSGASVTVDTTAPTITSANSASATEGGTSVITATATDAGGLPAAPWSLSGTDAALLSIDASTGVVTLNSASNYETKTSYSFNIVCTDKAGNAATQAFTFTVLNDTADDATSRSFVIGSELGIAFINSNGSRDFALPGGYVVGV